MNSALEEQKQTNEKIGQTLVSAGVIDEDDFITAYSMQMGYRKADNFLLLEADQDGYARIIAVFPRELCIWQATDEETGLCTFEDFNASISSTLLIPQITTSDPLDIQLVRTQTTVGCP